MNMKERYDYVLLLVVLSLVGIGLVMVYSSSSVIAQERFDDSYFFIKKQAVFSLVGLALMIAYSLIPYQHLRRFYMLALILGVASLIMVWIPNLGSEIRGSSRWVRVLNLSFQPSEFAKLGIVIFLAHSLAKKRKDIKSFTIGFLPHFVITLTFVLLIVNQPDLGAALAILTISITMMFVAGVRARYLAAVLSLAIPVTAFLIISEPYRMRRILSFIDPWKDPLGHGFHIIHSWLAFGSGGLFGVGLGAGRQKLFYLPEPNTDFILSVIGEEFGFVGVTIIMILFLIVIAKGISISLKAPDLFGSYLALGTTLLIGIHAFVHAGVVMGLLPTKGLTLPFISYGGSSLMSSMTSMGILLNISSQRMA